MKNIKSSNFSKNFLWAWENYRDMFLEICEDKLNERQLMVITGRIVNKQTLKQIGDKMFNETTKKYGLSQERVRSIEYQACRIINKELSLCFEFNFNGHINGRFSINSYLKSPEEK